MGRKPIIFRSVFLAILFGMVIFSAINCHGPRKNLTPKEAFLQIVDTATHYLNISDTVKYVGMHTCMLCHQNIHSTFIHTGMGESFDIASRQKSSARFGPHEVVYDTAKDFYYHPFWKGDSLYVLEYRLGEKNSLGLPFRGDKEGQGKDTIYKHVKQINYIIGSGMHTNSHMYSSNGYVYQIPITFYTQQGVWDLAPGFAGGYNTRFGREVGLECMTCHNSYPKFVEGSTNKFTDIPNGITCERCHGPGSMHVEAIQLGHIVDTAKAIDYTIVNPAKLPVDLQIDVCERCHLQGTAVLKPGKSFYDFKPGTKLSDMEDVFMPDYKGMDNEYIMASHIQRLKMSKCYLMSLKAGENSHRLEPYKDGLTCVTCHNPHIDVRTVNDNTFNTICQNCHSKEVNEHCTASLAGRNKVGDNCVSCHMPKGHTIDIPHVITTDHYIRIPETAAEKERDKVKKFITLYDVNNAHPTNLARGKAYIQQYARFESDRPLLLDSAKHYFPDATPAEIRKSFPELVAISFFKKDYLRIIDYVNVMQQKNLLDSILTHKSYDNDDAWTAYHIGEAYYETGDNSTANLFYKRGTALAPYILDFQNKLGTTQVLLSQMADARKTFDFILNQNPLYIPALTNEGYVYLLSGDTQKAKEYYDKALALDPDDEQALLNTAGWYIYNKDYKTAREYLNTVLQKYPNDVQAKATLEKLKML